MLKLRYKMRNLSTVCRQGGSWTNRLNGVPVKNSKLKNALLKFNFALLFMKYVKINAILVAVWGVFGELPLCLHEVQVEWVRVQGGPTGQRKSKRRTKRSSVVQYCTYLQEVAISYDHSPDAVDQLPHYLGWKSEKLNNRNAATLLFNVFYY